MQPVNEDFFKAFSEFLKPGGSAFVTFWENETAAPFKRELGFFGVKCIEKNQLKTYDLYHFQKK